MQDLDRVTWVGGVCSREGQLLLIHRINKERLFNQEYFIFPGKEVEGGKGVENTLRETFQELGITVTVNELIYSKEDDEHEYYYTCDPVYGEVTGQTTEKEGGEQYYTPLWISISELDDLVVYPESVKEIFLEKFSNSQ